VLAAKITILNPDELRMAAGGDVEPATPLHESGEPIDVALEDFSRAGFRFAADLALGVGALVSVALGTVPARAAEVTRRDGRCHVCAFAKPLDDTEMAQALAGQAELLGGLAAALAARRAPKRAEARPAFAPFRRLLRRPRRD
jgi:hypothetical protein